jgi:O-antigen ligase
LASSATTEPVSRRGAAAPSLASGPETAARLAVAALPALATLYLAFDAGGFFVAAPAVVAAALGVALVLRIVLAKAPFAGLGPGLSLVAGALGLYAVWTLASALWSHAPAQAMIEFDRALMLLLATTLLGSFPRDRRTLLWAIRALAAAMVLVAGAGLATRLAPDLLAAPAGVENNRLAYPLTYWNALGVFAAIAIVLCAQLASRRREPPLSKALGAAAVPVLAATLYFTFSRGGIAAALVGVCAYVLLARDRGLVPAALAIVPTTAAALVFCYRADLLATGRYASPAGIAQGHDLIPIVAACALAAGLIRLGLARVLDVRLELLRVTARARRSLAPAAVVAALAALIVAGAALDAPGRAGELFSRFVHSGDVSNSGDLRGRLTSAGNNGRLPQWRVGLRAFSADPLTGKGAGSFARVWARNGEGSLKVEDAHSLYVETLAELGLPGLALLLTALLGLLGGLAARIRGPDRAVHAALLAAGIAWAAHAGFDWDWEMPATSFWLFALGGMAIARPLGSGLLPAPGRTGRLALAVGCLALLVTPVLMALSQARLNSSVQALKSGDCRAASEDALAAAHLVSVRPEPYQVIGFCDSRAGEDRLAVKMLETAVARDRGAWDSYYGLALVRGAAEEDPRPAARKAFELAPREPLTRAAIRAFRTDDPRKWRRRALNARLPIQ